MYPGAFIFFGPTGCFPPEEEDDDDELGPNGVPHSHSHRHRSNLSAQDIMSRTKIGSRVVRGPDWKWGDQVSVCVCLHVSLSSLSLTFFIPPP